MQLSQGKIPIPIFGKSRDMPLHLLWGLQQKGQVYSLVTYTW